MHLFDNCNVVVYSSFRILRFTAMEVDFGIEEFLGDRSQKVSCVMKELYSDFVVQEILGIVFV